MQVWSRTEGETLLEKDEIKENQIVNNEEGAEETSLNVEETNITSVIEDQQDVEVNAKDESNEKNSIGALFAANLLDQLIMTAASAVLVYLIDLIMRTASGYMFVRDNGALILAGGIIYFILNCIYAPILERTKLENTFAKKILNLN